VFNATFNNISVISLRSVLLVEETGENHRPVARYVIQRTTDQGVPFDHKAVTRYGITVPFWLMKPFAYKRLNSRFDHSKYGLAPNGKFGLSAVTISDELPTRVLYGTISIKPNV
jgi:dimethylaniline monooxygenase (N-oxide forming)